MKKSIRPVYQWQDSRTIKRSKALDPIVPESIDASGTQNSWTDAAESVIDAALAPPLRCEISCKYFIGRKGQTIESSALSSDPKMAKELWDTSCLIFDELQQAHT
ncbi:predicted protein [Arabidopsis lyrata subsp. lyrata]|uniref:Predicted protein n=1 Tax=Arabidopsis lyrata subsp. lyrata TaxID=81972 RepID=D7LWR8_ARALL|nr:predicted protein [Arabidopsis lyrata subsp. lyrata]